MVHNGRYFSERVGVRRFMVSRMRWRLVAACTTAVAFGVVVSACASSSSGASAQSGTGAVPLVVYSAQGYDSAVTKAFSAATGIPVSLDDDSTGPLLTKVAAERNNPKWGLLWVDGDTAFA